MLTRAEFFQDEHQLWFTICYNLLNVQFAGKLIKERYQSTETSELLNANTCAGSLMGYYNSTGYPSREASTNSF